MIKYIMAFLSCFVGLFVYLACQPHTDEKKEPPKWKQFSMSGHTLAIKDDGSLWGWGLNIYYQLGLGHTYEVLTPTKIGTDTNWAMVSCGSDFSMAIKTDGTLWSWGHNDEGQLGMGDSGWWNFRKTPHQVGHDTDWINIYCGGSHTIARKRNGTLWACGDNVYGQLGLGDTISRTIPTQIGSDTDWSNNIATDLHTMALKINGTLWGFGWRSELGFTERNTERNVPIQIGNSSDWIAIASSDACIAIKKDGTLWGWRGNSSGQLGLGDKKSRMMPEQIGVDKDWVMVTTSGSGHTLALKANGTLWVCGDNVYGQLGLGISGNGTGRLVFCQVGTDTDWKSIACSGCSSTAMKKDGTLWGWGSNQRGTVGLGNKEKVHVPTQIK